MPKKKEAAAMGKVTFEVELKNHYDRLLADNGEISADDVRKIKVMATVDTGSTHLVIPKRVARELGVPSAGSVRLRFADRRTAYKEMVDEIEVELFGRRGSFKAIVEPRRDDILIGVLVLEDLDLIVDCRNQKLRPRDPEGIVEEVS